MRQKSQLFFLKGVEGGGAPSLEDMSPKKSSFSLLTPSLRVLKNCRHVNSLTLLYIRNDDIIQFYIWSSDEKKYKNFIFSRWCDFHFSKFRNLFSSGMSLFESRSL